MNFNYFFGAFFIASMLMYSMVKPETIDQTKVEKIPLLEFNDYTAYVLEKDKLRLMLTGEKAYRYKQDTVVENFAIYAENDNAMHMIKANKGVQSGDVFNLSGDILYAGGDDVSFSTQRVRYNFKDETFDIRTDFILTQNEHKFTGSSFFFNQKSGRILAKDIKAQFALEN